MHGVKMDNPTFKISDCETVIAGGDNKVERHGNVDARGIIRQDSDATAT